MTDAAQGIVTDANFVITSRLAFTFEGMDVLSKYSGDAMAAYEDEVVELLTKAFSRGHLSKVRCTAICTVRPA